MLVLCLCLWLGWVWGGVKVEGEGLGEGYDYVYGGMSCIFIVVMTVILWGFFVGGLVCFVLIGYNDNGKIPIFVGMEWELSGYALYISKQQSQCTRDPYIKSKP